MSDGATVARPACTTCASRVQQFLPEFEVRPLPQVTPRLRRARGA